MLKAVLIRLNAQIGCNPLQCGESARGISCVGVHKIRSIETLSGYQMIPFIQVTPAQACQHGVGTTGAFLWPFAIAARSDRLLHLFEMSHSTAFGLMRLGFGSFATLNSGGIMGDQMPCLSQV